MIRRRGRCASLVTLLAFALLTTCIAADYTQKNITNPPGYKLLESITSVPAPIGVAPDLTWIGIDGSWNTFSLRIGNPQDQVQVLVSTSSQQIWAVDRMACVYNKTDHNTKQIIELNAFNPKCETRRGRLFNTTESSSWRQKGYYALWLEKNLGLAGNGLFGFDSVGLGLAGETGPYVTNTTVGTLITPNFWLGHIGLHTKPTNMSGFEDPVPSYMTTLFNQKSIPSMSFGYTAGSNYRGQTGLGSLTLGGYDASRFIHNDLTFTFSPDAERDLVVGLTGLTANSTTSSNINLLKRDDVSMFIDSRIAELWLPIEVCEAFEQAFGLKYDNTTDLYLVDDALHQSLQKQQLNITFTLGQKSTTGGTVQITLPYPALDLVALPPYRGLHVKSRYFPIRRGNDSNQWVLGRTFLQEAYLVVDWEQHNFSISAVDWTYGNPVELMPIVSSQYAVPYYTSPISSSLHNKAMIGIAVGGGFVPALLVYAIGWYFWRRSHAKKLEAIKATYEADAAEKANGRHRLRILAGPPLSLVQDSVNGTMVIPKAELPDGSNVSGEINSSIHQKEASLHEMEDTGRQIFEMPGDVPCPEAGGRQLSEKESMVVRERIYNGVDPNGIPEVSPRAEPPLQRIMSISSAEITMVDRSSSVMSTVSPVTPRTPNATQGASLEANDTFFQLPPYQPLQDSRMLEGTLLSPISPLEGPTETSRRPFSHESRFM